MGDLDVAEHRRHRPLESVETGASVGGLTGLVILATEDNDVVVAARLNPQVVIREEGTRGVHVDFARLYRALADMRIDCRWEGLFATTPDGLPYIGPHGHYPRHLFALGYWGNGMTFGFLAVRLLLDWYRGDRSADQALFAFSR